ncbi:helix-turn-helix domain-containing protein [Vibrio sinensis]|nr:AraC family transcriptional regulator [Vibrio sinensis]
MALTQEVSMFPFSFSQRSHITNNKSGNVNGHTNGHVNGMASSQTGYEVVTFAKDPINIFAAEVRQCEPHWHLAPEFICVLKGAFSMMSNGSSETFKQGGMLLLSGNEIHGLHALEPNSQLLTIQFSPALFEACHHSLALSYRVVGKEYYRQLDTELWNTVKALACEYSYDENRVSFKRMALIYLMLAKLDELGEECELNIARKHEEEVVRACLERIDREYMSSLTLSDLCLDAGLSYHHFSRLFKRVCGFNFKDYLTFIRLSKSIPLLCNTAIPITDIALQCGFSEHKYLIAAFRKFHDMTPTEFRKYHHGGSENKMVTPGVTVLSIKQVFTCCD